MIQPNDDNPTTSTPTEPDADQLWNSYQAVRERTRELSTALTQLGQHIKTARKQDKTVKAELDSARGVLKKLQAIEL